MYCKVLRVVRPKNFSKIMKILFRVVAHLCLTVGWSVAVVAVRVGPGVADRLALDRVPL